MRAVSNLFLKFVFLGAVVTFTACATRNSQEEVVPDTVEDAAVDSSAMNFQFPLKTFKRLGRGFKKKHKGIDISADKNTPILASESGWVTYAGRRFKGFGKLVIIEHSKVWATFYGHLNTYAVEQGKWVNKGDVIGYVGSTGRSTGYHLHFEIRRSHVPIDPMIYFYNDNLKIGSN